MSQPAAEKPSKTKTECFRVSWALLGEWWCSPADMSEDACLAEVVKAALVTATPEMIRERLYGGFGCDKPGRRHFYHATGQYTYLGPNEHLTEEERRETWKKIIDANGEPGVGPFSAAGPSEPKATDPC